MTKKKQTKEEWQNIVGSVVEDGKNPKNSKDTPSGSTGKKRYRSKKVIRGGRMSPDHPAIRQGLTIFTPIRSGELARRSEEREKREREAELCRVPTPKHDLKDCCMIVMGPPETEGFRTQVQGWAENRRVSEEAAFIRYGLDLLKEMTKQENDNPTMLEDVLSEHFQQRVVQGETDLQVEEVKGQRYPALLLHKNIGHDGFGNSIAELFDNEVVREELAKKLAKLWTVEWVRVLKDAEPDEKQSSLSDDFSWEDKPEHTSQVRGGVDYQKIMRRNARLSRFLAESNSKDGPSDEALAWWLSQY